jgi:hypothetical protein
VLCYEDVWGSADITPFFLTILQPYRPPRSTACYGDSFTLLLRHQTVSAEIHEPHAVFPQGKSPSDTWDTRLSVLQGRSGCYEKKNLALLGIEPRLCCSIFPLNNQFIGADCTSAPHNSPTLGHKVNISFYLCVSQKDFNMLQGTLKFELALRGNDQFSYFSTTVKYRV